MTYSVVIYLRPDMPHHKEWCGKFAQGLIHHGITVETRMLDDPIDCDLAVFWSHKFYNVIKHQKKNNADYICLERGFVDRENYAHVGWNGHNGRADFKNAGAPSDRFERFQHMLKPWKQDGDYLLIMGQVPGDASTMGVELNLIWDDVGNKAAELDINTIYRPHPLVEYTCPLEVSLKNALAVIAWNSNSSVDAVLAGVPSIVLDEGSMAWPVSSHEIGEIVRPDRTKWLHELAYAQWSRTEISSGECWDRIKPG